MNNRAQVIVLLAAILFMIFYASKAQALNYQEHAFITYEAANEFCLRAGALRADTPAFDLCDPNHRAERLKCFAHYTALAADRTRNAADLFASKDNLWLIGDGVDCSTLIGAKTIPLIAPSRATKNCLTKSQDKETSEAEKKETWPPESCHWANQLFTSDLSWCLSCDAKYFKYLYRYVGLAAHNVRHFPPTSIDSWKNKTSVLNHPINVSTTENSLSHPGYVVAPTSESADPRQLWFARAAFRIHYLEDSLAAGHIGLQRWRYRHDYDNAFHDDYNGMGRFITIDGRTSFVFGDFHLLKHSYYIDASQLKSKGWEKTFEKTFGVNVGNDLHTFQQGLDQLASVDDEHVVISFEKSSDITGLCGFFVPCERREIVAVPKNWLPPPYCVRKVAHREEGGDEELVFYDCDDTYEVYRVAVIEAFTRLFVGRDDGVEDESESAGPQLPTDYFRIPLSNAFLGEATSSVLSEPQLFRYERQDGNWLKDSNPGEEPYYETALSMGATTGSATHRDRVFISLGGDFSVVTRTAAKIAGGANAGSSSPREDQGARISDWFKSDFRLDIVDNKGHVLNSAAFGVAINDIRAISNLVGIGAKTGVGWDNLFDGGSNRNYFGYLAGTFDIHVARYAFYADAIREWHHNGTYGTWPEWRIIIGVRVLALDPLLLRRR